MIWYRVLTKQPIEDIGISRSHPLFVFCVLVKKFDSLFSFFQKSAIYIFGNINIVYEIEGARHCRKPLGMTKGPIYRFFELVTAAAFDCTKIQNMKPRIELSNKEQILVKYFYYCSCDQNCGFSAQILVKYFYYCSCDQNCGFCAQILVKLR